VDGRSIACKPRGQDQYGRTIALCRADGRDSGAEMVRAGMAFVRYSADYVQDEAKAKAAGRGVHAHRCAPPWEWRATQRKAN
jgi:endonuclease YncB( thermonuclease family)